MRHLAGPGCLPLDNGRAPLRLGAVGGVEVDATMSPARQRAGSIEAFQGAKTVFMLVESPARQRAGSIEAYSRCSGKSSSSPGLPLDNGRAPLRRGSSDCRRDRIRRSPARQRAGSIEARSPDPDTTRPGQGDQVRTRSRRSPSHRVPHQDRTGRRRCRRRQMRSGRWMR